MGILSDNSQLGILPKASTVCIPDEYNWNEKFDEWDDKTYVYIRKNKMVVII